MRREEAAGICLGLSTLGILFTMAFHPTGHEVVSGGAGTLNLNAAVHALAILTMPLALYGLLVFTRRLAAPNLPRIAFLFYLLGSVAGMIAAVASGFIGPAVSDDSVLFHYTGYVNRGFATILVLATSIAILLWSIALLRQVRWLGIVGIIIGVLVFVAVASGHVRLNVHGFGAVVIAQSIWTVCVAVLLVRGRFSAE